MSIELIVVVRLPSPPMIRIAYIHVYQSFPVCPVKVTPKLQQFLSLLPPFVHEFCRFGNITPFFENLTSGTFCCNFHRFKRDSTSRDQIFSVPNVEELEIWFPTIIQSTQPHFLKALKEVYCKVFPCNIPKLGVKVVMRNYGQV